MRKIAIGLIRGYKYLSPLKPPTCRFIPSCSEYAIAAIGKYGVVKGGMLGIGRILRCNPLNSGGIDEVP